MIILVSIFSNALAQITSKANFEVSSQDSSAKSFFDQHPDLDRIVIRYKKDTAANVSFYYRAKQDKGFQIELLDLTFEGDRYLLDKKYRSLPLPKPAKLAMQYLAGIPNLSKSKTGYDLTTTLHPDSLINSFSFYISNDENASTEPSKSNSPKSKVGFSKFQKKPEQNVKQRNPNTVYDFSSFNRARFRGDILQLQKTLEQKYKQWKPISVQDSILLLTGIVEKNGFLGKLGLEIGDPSQFSKKISEVLELEATSWWPAIVSSGSKVRYKVKFFIKLNSNDSLTVSIL